MKKLQWTLIVFLVVLTGVLFYTNRAAVASSYDATYWKDRFDHSQWQLPLSPRTLGDNGLYAFVGYQLVHGADPTAYNAEFPPLGKYAIGAVIRLTGRSALYGVFAALISASLFYLLSRRILKNTTFALIATTWLAFDLLFVSQWTATMLDTLQLSALLLFFLLLGQSAVLAGLALGIFSAIKFPLFTPILLVGGMYYLWKKHHSLESSAVFIMSAFATYLFTYIRYFLSGHIILDWLHVQKWIFTFYTSSALSPNVGSVVTTLLANRYQNLFTKTWESVPEWSLSWPIISILNGYIVYRYIRQQPRGKELLIPVIWVSIVLIMFLYTVIPFWTRYLLLVIPFLYIGAAAAVRTMKPTWVMLMLVFSILGFNAYTSWHGIFPTPKADVEQFVYDWKNGFFQDMYERFTESAKKGEERGAFLGAMQRLMHDGEIEAVDIAVLPGEWNHFTSPQYVSLNLTYSTRRLGEFSRTVRVPVILEKGLWRIPWKPEYFIPGLAPGDSLKTTVAPAKRGAIIDQTGSVLARDLPGYMVWITPKLVDTSREGEMLKLLESIFGYPRFSAVSFYHRYIVNSPAEKPVPIAVLPPSVTDAALQSLRAYPGVTLTDALTRYQAGDKKDEIGLMQNTHFTECCSYLYTTTTYDGISGLEKTYNARLKGENGGTLELIDRVGNILRTLIEKEKKDGEDVLL